MIAKRIPGKMRNLARTVRYAIGVSSTKELANYATQAEEIWAREGVSNVRWTNCSGPTVGEALGEMEMVQSLNERVKEKTYHLVVSFPLGERPDNETLNKIEDRFCEGLGFKHHQRISSQHHDTDYLHLHIVINQIDPVTTNKHEPYYDKLKLMKMCDDIEADFGLIKTNHQSQAQESLPTKVQDMEAHQDEQSFLGWTKEHVQPALAEVTNWQQMHDVMADFGLEIRKRGNGLAIVDQQSGLAVKASSVDRTLSLTKLTARMGQFEEDKHERTRTSTGAGRHAAGADGRSATTAGDARDSAGRTTGAGADGGTTGRDGSATTDGRRSDDNASTRDGRRGNKWGTDTGRAGDMGGSSHTDIAGISGESYGAEAESITETESLSDMPAMSSSHVDNHSDARSDVLLPADAQEELGVQEQDRHSGLRRAADHGHADDAGVTDGNDIRKQRYQKGNKWHPSKAANPMYDDFVDEKRAAQATRLNMVKTLKKHDDSFKDQAARWVELRKAVIKQSKLPAAEKKRMYQELAVERKELMAAHFASMKEARAMIPKIPSWLDYLTRQAAVGDSHALETLRKRKILQDRVLVNVIKADDISKVKDLVLKDSNPKILKNGTAIYQTKDGGQIVDRKETIQLTQESVASAVLALAMAEQKFGQRPLNIQGTLQFKELLVKASIIYGGNKVSFADPAMEAERKKLLEQSATKTPTSQKKDRGGR